ncbi:MAG: hypothetical protein ACD_55C00076G0002 [uncultured bacterium]|uniref:Glycosyltransferase, putative n=1 Tax=Citrifermentans bemidjiense (strain ATCC BAA-1014 / DSM 16622 / JCM 12645 / Bem) TaxID=404380 RepID=B5EGU2_CITBB|nr:glycosyltransferase [Citrifermentans bemidjiense]ACH39575.1 glycosyltransferase, putative [Citrifermentans bemidjiense Bem]EKD59317.1 MAG: hypothetical protein ACD_55C00076G0002 [uncultured bacterium]
MDAPPIALFAYNRLTHTRRTVEALQKNHGADKSPLYVFCDGPKSERDLDAVNEVRAYLKGVDGFSSVEVIESEANAGLAASLTRGICLVLDEYDSIIVLEDDLVTSPYFLKFMRDALRRYRDEERVASVSGYSFPLGIKTAETFLLNYTACWGWGTWRRGWQLFEPSGEKLLSEIGKRGLSHEFDMRGAYPYTRMLEDQCRGKVDSWAVRWHASLFLAGRLMLFPGRSLVNNIGHDGSGVNCQGASHFDVTLSDTAVLIGDVPLAADATVAAAMEKFFRELNPGLFRYLLRKLTTRFSL